MVGLTTDKMFQLGAQVIELPHRRPELEGRMEMVKRVMVPFVVNPDVDLDRSRPINQRERKADFLIIRIRVEQPPNQWLFPPGVVELSHQVDQFLQYLILHIYVLIARTDG